METRKVTVELPVELLERAQKQSGAGITQTIREGLQILAASSVFDELLKLEGKVQFDRTWEEIKEDR